MDHSGRPFAIPIKAQRLIICLEIAEKRNNYQIISDYFFNLLEHI